MFKRGFKTWCENTSGTYRRRLGLKKQDPLNPFHVAKHLEMIVITPAEVQGLSKETIDILLKSASDEWSAATLSVKGKIIIIYNSSHTPARQSNDLMHEISHIIIGHTPQYMHSFNSDMFLRHYDDLQEAEADCLAATLLLPRDALIAIKYSGISLEEAAQKYSVSKQLLNMRLNTSGVNQIYRRQKLSRTA